MDVNEQIVEQYLKLVMKWFYMTDISFKVPYNYSNIDLLAYNPLDDKYYDIEVKYRLVFTISLANREKDTEFKKFVTTYKLFGLSIDKKQQVEKEFIKLMLSSGFDCEIWYFDEIIPKIYNQTDLNGRYNTELLQTIRFIKTYIKQ
jgi:hypothetical protein